MEFFRAYLSLALMSDSLVLMLESWPSTRSRRVSTRSILRSTPSKRRFAFSKRSSHALIHVFKAFVHAQVQIIYAPVHAGESLIQRDRRDHRDRDENALVRPVQDEADRRGPRAPPTTTSRKVHWNPPRRKKTEPFLPIPAGMFRIGPKLLWWKKFRGRTIHPVDSSLTGSGIYYENSNSEFEISR